MTNGAMAELRFDGRSTAPLATTTEDGSTVSVLRSIVDAPEAHELFGVVEVNNFAEGVAFYGLSRIASTKNGLSSWQGLLSKRITVIHPKADECVTTRELPWRITFVPGSQKSDFMVNYRGGQYVDVLAAPANGEQLLTDLPEGLWLPDPGQLIAQIAPITSTTEQ